MHFRWWATVSGLAVLFLKALNPINAVDECPHEELLYKYGWATMLSLLRKRKELHFGYIGRTEK